MKRQKLNRLLEIVNLGEWRPHIRLHNNLERIKRGKTWLKEFLSKEDAEDVVKHSLGCTDLDPEIMGEDENTIWVRYTAYRGERVHIFIPRHSNQLDLVIHHYELESSRNRLKSFTSKLTPKEIDVLLTTFHEIGHAIGYIEDREADNFAREKLFELLEYYRF